MTSLYPFDIENFKDEKSPNVVFSGFGGDQALSHNALNVPCDFLNEGRILTAYKWFNCDNKFIYKIYSKKICL